MCWPGPSPAPRAGLAVAGAADRGPDVARPLADAAAVLGPVAELGDLDLRQGDRDELAPRLADHLAVGDVLPQVGLDLAADDLLEPVGVTIDFSHHGSPALAVACLTGTRSRTLALREAGRSLSLVLRPTLFCKDFKSDRSPPGGRAVYRTSGTRPAAQAATSAARKDRRSDRISDGKDQVGSRRLGSGSAPNSSFEG